MTNPALKENIDQIKEFISDMIPLLHKPDDTIIEEGDKGKYFYCLAVGKCSVLHKNYPNCPNEKPKMLKAGDYFGELSLIFNCRRTCSIKSQNYSTLARIEQDKFLKSSRQFILQLRNETLNYKDRYKCVKLEMLKTIDYLEVHSYDQSKIHMFYDII